MKAYKYHLGQWSETEIDWRKDEEEYDFLERNDYEASIDVEIGNEHALSIQAHKKKDRDEWIILLSLDASTFQCILVEGFPNLMNFLKDYAPIVSQGNIEHLIKEDLLPALSKAFRAWHGHEYYGHCMSCDPVQTMAEQRAMERLRKNSR